MSTSGRTSYNRSFLGYINARFPWLKLVVLVLIGIAAILDLLDYTVPRAGETQVKISIAPMSKHVRAIERNLDGKKLVALTFDDGPLATTTPLLLDILESRNVPVTFFMLGSMIRNNPEIVKRAAREGHEVASHTMYHQNLIYLSDDAAQADINEAKSVFEEVLGKFPSLTRPPYGNYDDNVSRAVNTPMVLWSVDTRDWESRNPDSIVSTALSQAFDGAIILMHDIYETSVAAVPRLIDEMRGSGYEFVTVSELAREHGASLENGVAYRGL